MLVLNRLRTGMPRVAPLALAVLFFYGEGSAAQLQLTWTDNSGNENGFKIERGPSSTGPFSQIATIAANVTSYTDAGLTDTTMFCYRVRAYNTTGDSAYTNTACATTGATLTLAKAGTGGGTITSSPGGISCGTTCSASYTKGTSVTLTATAAVGSLFTGWSGACTGTAPCVVSMTAAKSVTATFNSQTFALTASKSGTGGGTIASSPGGIACGGTCSANYTAGTTVTLTATAAAGSRFAGWNGACIGTGSCIVVMDAAKAVSASFNVMPPSAPGSLSVM